MRFQKIHRGVRWAVSVKSNQQIKQVASAEFVDKGWEELLGRSGSGFALNRDLLGLVTAPMGGNHRQHLDELMRLAVDQDPLNLNRRMRREGYAGVEKRKLWDSFRGPSDSAGISDSPGEFLRRFRYLDLDLMSSGSKAETKAIEWCEQVVVDPAEGRLLWDSLLAEVSRIRTAGEYMDTGKLRNSLRSRYSLRGDSRSDLRYVERLRRISRARLIERWRAVGVQEAMAAKLADDASVGECPGRVPGSGVVALVGGLGSGKSVAAERVHLEDIAAYADDADQPIPVFVSARQVQGSLEESVKKILPMRVGVDVPGVRLVLDGLDEVDMSLGAQLLEEARVLARVEPSTRVLVTMRPGLPIRDEEKAVPPQLNRADLGELSLRITGYRFHLDGLPEPVMKAVRYPLFALIALNLRNRAAELPSSRALFVEALVKEALGAARDKAMSNLEALARAATLSIAGSGWFSENHLGGPDVTAALVATGLIVRDGANLRFALPVLEQYFGAYALLREHIPVSDVVSDLGTFEVWRYAFVMAVGLGSWEKICKLLETLGCHWPGAACWVIDQAISKRIPRQSPAEAILPLPDSLECARRLRRTLTVLVSWLPGIARLVGLVDQQGQLVTVGAFSEDESVVGGIGFSKDPAMADVIELDLPRDYMAPESDPRLNLIRSGTPPPGEQGWPWRWGMEWVASRIETLLKDRKLPLPSNSPLREEYEWSLAQHIVKSHPNNTPYGWSIAPQQVVAAGERLLSLLDHDPRSSVVLDNHVIWYAEIENIVSRARYRPNAPFMSSWPPRDNHPEQWRQSGQYSPQAMRDTIEKVYASALLAYDDLSGYPRWDGEPSCRFV